MRNRYKVGQRFGKIELIGVDTIKGIYKFMCDCGEFFNKSCDSIHRKFPPRDCAKCRVRFNGLGNSVDSDAVVREYTPEEQELIKRFEDEKDINNS